MKTIRIKISCIFIIALFSSCKNIVEKKSQSTNKISIEVDTLNGRINYSINIFNENCIKKTILTSIPIDQGKGYLLEVYDEDNQYELFYEYTSVRPVYNKVMYIDKKSLRIDSIVNGFFNFEKINYDFEKKLVNKDICNYNFREFIKN